MGRNIESLLLSLYGQQFSWLIISAFLSLPGNELECIYIHGKFIARKILALGETLVRLLKQMRELC